MDANGEFLSTVEKAALCTFDPSESELIGRGLRDYMWTCMFVKLYMHECASQSLCASASVSTLGLSTKPAQRQMGNFLRGKRGGKKNLERQQKRQDVCLSLLF